MSLAKANLCNKVPSRGTLGNSAKSEDAQGPKERDRSYFRPERTTGKVRRLKISVHSRRDIYVYGKLERSNHVVCSEIARWDSTISYHVLRFCKKPMA